MSVRQSAGGDALYRTANLPSPTNMTFFGFLYIVSLSAATIMLKTQNTASTEYFFVEGDGTTFQLSDPAGSTGFTYPTTGIWYALAITADATNLKGYMITLSSLAVNSVTRASRSFTPDFFRLFDEWDSNPANVRFAGVRIWDAALTQDEILAECRSIKPRRWANLNLWTPLPAINNVNDYSGNARNWAITGLSTEDNPPVRFSKLQSSIWMPNAAAPPAGTNPAGWWGVGVW